MLSYARNVMQGELLVLSQLPPFQIFVARSTIKSYLSAISYAHKLKGFNDPTKSFLIDKLLTALSRQQPSDIRLPITRSILHQLISSLTFSNSSAFQRSHTTFTHAKMLLVPIIFFSQTSRLCSGGKRFD